MRTLAALTLAVTLVGCASLVYSPVQMRSLAAFETCQRKVWGVSLNSVAPDGQVSYMARNQATLDEMRRCARDPANWPPLKPVTRATP
jgi:hypothetical protein